METRIHTMTVLVVALIACLIHGVDGLRVHSSLQRTHRTATPQQQPQRMSLSAPSQPVTSEYDYTSCTVISYDDDNCLTYPQGQIDRPPFGCDAETNTFLSVTGTFWSINQFHSPNCTDYYGTFNGTLGQCSGGVDVICRGGGPTPAPTVNTLTLFNVSCEAQFWQSPFLSGQCLQGPGGDAPFQSWMVKVDSSTSAYTADFFDNFNCSGDALQSDFSRGNMCMTTNKLEIYYQVQASVGSSPCTVSTYINNRCTNSAPLSTYAASPTVCVPGTHYTVATNKLLIDPVTKIWTIQYFNTNDTTCSGPIVGTETASANDCDQGGNRRVVCTSAEAIELA